MFPTRTWEWTPTLGWENPPLRVSPPNFPQFTGIGTLLDYGRASATAINAGSKKGVFEMSAKSQLSRTLLAIAGAIVMSTVAVAAAVAPIEANAIQAPVYA